MTKKEFLYRIEKFLAESQMSHTAFGKAVMHDASFVKRLRVGADVRLGTVEKVLQWIEEYHAAA